MILLRIAAEIDEWKDEDQRDRRLEPVGRPAAMAPALAELALLLLSCFPASRTAVSGVGSGASGEQKTSLAQKPRTPEIEVKKRGDARSANGGGDVIHCFVGSRNATNPRRKSATASIRLWTVLKVASSKEGAASGAAVRMFVRCSSWRR